jgi:hypothetical protein
MKILLAFMVVLVQDSTVLNHGSRPMLGFTAIENQESVQLYIELPGKKFVVGEPITITARLTNVSTRPLVLFNNEDFLHLEIATDGNQYRRFADEFVKKRSYKQQTLEPGKSWVYYKTLLRGVLHRGIEEDYLMFPRVGKYSVRARYDAGKESNAVEFEVVLPQGNDAEVWRLLQNQNAADDYTRLLKYGGPTYLEPRREQIVEQFYRVVEKYPKSIYAEILTPRLIRHFEERMNERASPPLSEQEKTWHQTLRARGRVDRK